MIFESPATRTMSKGTKNRIPGKVLKSQLMSLMVHLLDKVRRKGYWTDACRLRAQGEELLIGHGQRLQRARPRPLHPHVII